MNAQLSISRASPLDQSEDIKLLDWLAARLQQLGLIASPATAKQLAKQVLPITVFEQRYSLTLRSTKTAGSPGSDTGPAQETWLLVLEKRRGLVDGLLGRNALDGDDAFLRILSDVLDRESWVAEVEVSWR